MTTVLNGQPSRYSGFDPVCSFGDAAGRQFWLCRATGRGTVRAQLRDIGDIEPLLSERLLDECKLHPYNGPLDVNDRSLVALVRKIARCHCLVVSQTALDDDAIRQLASPASALVSRARPWLTLLSCSTPTVSYWHQEHAHKTAMDFWSPSGLSARASFVAKGLLAALPHQLVVKTDAFGVALLRRWGPQLLSAVPQVSLLIEASPAEPADRLWLEEFLDINYSALSALIIGDTPIDDPAGRGGFLISADRPRVIRLWDEA